MEGASSGGSDCLQAHKVMDLMDCLNDEVEVTRKLLGGSNEVQKSAAVNTLQSRPKWLFQDSPCRGYTKTGAANHNSHSKAAEINFTVDKIRRVDFACRDLLRNSTRVDVNHSTFRYPQSCRETKTHHSTIPALSKH